MFFFLANGSALEDTGVCGDSFLSPMFWSFSCSMLWSLRSVHNIAILIYTALCYCIFSTSTNFPLCNNYFCMLSLHLEGSNINFVLDLEAVLLLTNSCLNPLWADITSWCSFVGMDIGSWDGDLCVRLNCVLFDSCSSSWNLCCIFTLTSSMFISFQATWWTFLQPIVSRKLGRSGSILTRGLNKRRFFCSVSEIAFGNQLLYFCFHQGQIVTDYWSRSLA